MVGGDSTGTRNASLAGLMLAVEPAASDRIGGIYRLRVGMRSRPAAVIDESGLLLTVVLPKGEVRTVGSGTIRELVVPANAQAVSLAGRVHSLVSASASRNELSEAALSSIGDQLTRLLSDRVNAVGVLLDRAAVGLDDDACFALSVESWRVAYELLGDAQRGTEREAALARRVVDDESAPLGIRTAVALSHGVDVSRVMPAFADLFPAVASKHHETALFNVARVRSVESSAITAGEALKAIGLSQGQSLAEAVTRPSQYIGSSLLAAAISALDDQLPTDKSVQIVPQVPSPIIDDLIDRRVRIAQPDLDPSVEVDGIPGLSLRSYVTGRLQPTDLTADEIRALRFEDEAHRRVVLGDDELADVLAEGRRRDAEIACQIRNGSTPDGQATDKRLIDLLEILQSGTFEGSTRSVLSDVTTWPALLPLAQRAGPPNGQFPERLAEVAVLQAALESMFEWDWDGARATARDGLRWATREAVRDELLNIVACSFWLQGEHAPALSALEKALEGEYTEPLLTNTAVVAAELDHQQAVQHFTRIAREAPSAEMRATAAERALVLWERDDDRVWEDTDEEDELPQEIRVALRGLISEPLPDDRYIRLLRTLAIHDDDWLAEQASSAFGNRASDPTVRVFQARARGLSDFAEALAAELRTVNPPQWMLEERDSIVQAAINVLADDVSNVGRPSSAWHCSTQSCLWTTSSLCVSSASLWCPSFRTSTTRRPSRTTALSTRSRGLGRPTVGSPTTIANGLTG
jgi:hypothetical protein